MRNVYNILIRKSEVHRLEENIRMYIRDIGSEVGDCILIKKIFYPIVTFCEKVMNLRVPQKQRLDVLTGSVTSSFSRKIPSWRYI